MIISRIIVTTVAAMLPFRFEHELKKIHEHVYEIHTCTSEALADSFTEPIHCVAAIHQKKN